MSRVEYFRKTNTTAFTDALDCEAEGLRLLRAALADTGCTAVAVPDVISVSPQELVMEQIHARPAKPELMAALGEGLARLHRQPHEYYGLDHNNYIGLMPQKNRWADNWGAFFRDDRLGYQISRMGDAGIREEFERTLAKNSQSLEAFLNEHCDQPSLLHGDLWSGNALFDQDRAWLIDPAVYYGDREADLAMTEFFGGFSPEFYRAYDKIWPRTDLYSAKRDIYNLYHALNHYNLFGSGYLGQCRRLLLNLDSTINV
ncbi:MAG: fructosamine kinase family protein [Pseudomonadota bacterium]